MQRFTRSHPCPVCGGYDDHRLGDERCYGFLSSDGRYAHCTRSDLAGRLELHPASNTYAHRLDGPCRCDQEHGQAVSVERVIPIPRRSPTRPASFDPAVAWERIAVRYVYRDEAGQPLFMIARYAAPKAMRPWHPITPNPDPTNRRHWRMGLTDKRTGQPVRRVLYRLPELRAASPDVPVFVVEGEKDTESLRRHGCVATCNPLGAGKWLPEYSRHLAGRDVVILPDNDDAGRDHARLVARSVYRLARSVKIVELPGLPPGGDVSDWLAGMTRGIGAAAS